MNRPSFLNIDDDPEQNALLWTMYLDLVRSSYTHARMLVDDPHIPSLDLVEIYKLEALHDLLMEPERCLDVCQLELRLRARYYRSFDPQQFERAIIALYGDLNRDPSNKVVKQAVLT